MQPKNRREFLANVGQGMLAATLGYGAAVELGLTRALAGDVSQRISFGSRESLVALMQETPIDRLMPALVGQLREGTSLKELVAAGALANARTFGGEDYVGFHSFMALLPAWHMAGELPAAQAALPVLKVLYRNTNRIQEHGGSASEVLHPIAPPPSADSSQPAAQAILQAVRDKNIARAEQLLATSAQQSLEQAYNDMLPTVEDAVEVHRTVLAYRVWDLLDMVGREHALTMLRQSLHYCCDVDKPSYSLRYESIRKALPGLLDRYRLLEVAPGTREADDRWVDQMCQTLLTSTPDQAADAVAAALAEGFRAADVSEAIALVANQLLLRDPGRPARYATAAKPEGSVHGDSIGVHASDSVNAWSHIAQVSNRRNSVVSLILSGWQVAADRAFGASDLTALRPRPDAEQLEKIAARDSQSLLRELDDAIRHNDQLRACAATQLYGAGGFAPQGVLDSLRSYAVSEDGALHAEKYYRTATEEFARTRPAFRWRQLVALARVTASAYGQPAPGMDEARRLLGV